MLPHGRMATSRRSAHAVRLMLISLVALGCVSGLAHALAQPNYAPAYARGEQRQPRHYALDAYCHDGLSAAHRVRIEVRDGLVVTGADGDSGHPLGSLRL